ncbi:hypothetical protein [Pedobacter sp. L105]|uniref:hypothetical protein n=1 Tax=Pedobacter sp. L105 TaxID=1641871 RepID=UPI00131DCE48|nr:hypothetical protein [Pedobacter sp. L105]
MSAVVKKRWYSYLGSPAAVNLPSSYIYSPATPTCTAGFTLCSVYAIYAGALPSIITSNLQTYIASVLSTGVPQPTGIGSPKAFVYGKA